MFDSFPQSRRNDRERDQSPAWMERPKRAQVARACAWCRLNRVKCDNRQPCRNCEKRNLTCQKNKSEVLTLPLALKQINELKSQVAALQSSLVSTTAGPPSGQQVASVETGDSSTGAGWSPMSREFVSPQAHRSTSQFFGLSSLQGLLYRLSLHLSLVYGWRYTEEQLQPKPVTLPISDFNDAAASPSSVGHIGGVFMRKEQEEECLKLFWQSYHCAVPILDERQVREHHLQLWKDHSGGSSRADSPLIDIMLAICIQYGMTRFDQTPNEAAREDTSSLDPSNAGRWYFQRCQSLLKAEVETPSTMLVQCQILSVIYLRDASLFNTALSVVASATQTAYALGLHLEPHQSSDRIKSEMHKRLWCMVFVLESKMNMDYGRPFFTPQFKLQPPRDDQELASVSSEMYMPESDLEITWLTYHVHHVKLIRLAREVVAEVGDRRQNILATNDGEDFSQGAESLLDFDEFVAERLKLLASWLDDVPIELQCHLPVSHGTPVSHGSRPELQLGGPLWLQRQRVMLRLLYHDIVINICRPFILFSYPSDTDTRPSTKCAAECLSHAAAVTDIVHQAMEEETDFLHGWHRAYQFQWNAAISMVAFAMGEPKSIAGSGLLNAIENAIAVLESFGRSFAVARSAGRIIRELYGRLHIVIAKS